MNFAKLFAAGRGLAGGKGQPSPFRMNQRLLPKFNEDRVGRFERTTVPVEPRLDLFPVERAPEPGPQLEPDRELEAEAFAGGGDEPAVAEARAAQEEMERAAEQRTFFQQAVRKRKPTQARLEQAELELERVRVVRNSLEESDLELVAVAGRRRNAAGVIPTARAAGTVWGWVTDHLFKSKTA